MMTSTAIPPGYAEGRALRRRQYLENEPFPEYAKRELKNDQLRNNLRFVTHAIRNKRARVTSELPDWQELRNTGEMVKNYVLFNLPQMLEQFERNFTARGGHVHWARDAQRGKPDRPRSDS